MALNKIPGIKVSRIYRLPATQKKYKSKNKHRSQYYLPHSISNTTVSGKYSASITKHTTNHDELVKEGQLLLNNKVMHLFNGSYKKHKAASIELAKFAVNNFEIMKELKQPNIMFHMLNPFNIFYWARMGRVLILDALRTKTPEELLYRELGQAEKIKINKEKELRNIILNRNIDK